MSTGEHALAWRLFQANWIPLAAMGLVLAGVLAATDFAFTAFSAAFCFGYVAVHAAFAYYNALAPHRRDPLVVFVLGVTAQLVLTTAIMTPLTYAAAALNFPLQDAALYRIDQALGLDWSAYLDAVNARPWLCALLDAGYAMIRWPLFIIPVALALSGQYRRMQEFTLAFALGLIATTALSALVPAIGTFHHIGLAGADYANLNPAGYLSQLRDLPPTRDGTLRNLSLLSLAGVVTFPSFHAASAVLFTWALWPVRGMRTIAIISNGLMLAATPIFGGHYFIDIAAGLAVAALAIAAARRFSGRVEALQTGALRPTVWAWRPRPDKQIVSTS